MVKVRWDCFLIRLEMSPNPFAAETQGWWHNHPSLDVLLWLHQLLLSSGYEEKKYLQPLNLFSPTSEGCELTCFPWVCAQRLVHYLWHRRDEARPGRALTGLWSPAVGVSPSWGHSWSQAQVSAWVTFGAQQQHLAEGFGAQPPSSRAQGAQAGLRIIGTGQPFMVAQQQNQILHFGLFLGGLGGCWGGEGEEDALHLSPDLHPPPPHPYPQPAPLHSHHWGCEESGDPCVTHPPKSCIS